MGIHKEMTIKGTKKIRQLDDMAFKDFVKESISWLYGEKVYVSDMTLKRNKDYFMLKIKYKHGVGFSQKATMEIQFSDKLCVYNSINNPKVDASSEWIKFYQNALNPEVKPKVEEPELINSK